MNQGDIELGRFTANSHTSTGEGTYSMLRFSNAVSENDIVVEATADSDSRTTKIEMVSGTGAEVKIDLADAYGLALKIREVEVCVGGVTHYMLVIGSPPYPVQKSPA